jgi:TonB family protein
MSCRTCFLLLSFCLAQITVRADSLKDALNHKYKKQVLALRAPVAHGDMKFDSDGHSLNPPLKDRWLLYSGIYIEKLSLSQDTLGVEGALAFFSQTTKKSKHPEKQESKPVLVKLNKPVRVEIKLAQPLQSLDQAEAVLDRVFFPGTEATEHAYLELRRSDFTANEHAYRFDEGGAKAPRAIFTPEPEYSEEARRERFQGIVVLNVVVDKAGNISRIKLVRSLGHGLDQKAMEKVASWRFDPGTHNGEPAAVEMNIEVDFRLH